MQPVAVITGGKGDLALALAGLLQDAGYTVLNPGRDELDVTSQESVEKWFEEREVDFLINNAGCLCDTPAVRMREEQWDTVLSTNVRGAFLCAKAVLPTMLKRRAGHLLQIGSFSARSGPVGQAAYAASKAALIGLTQSLAKEGGRRGVRANIILPGYLKTRFTSAVSEDVEAEHLRAHVLGRFNTVQDAARFVVFLDSMTNVSGQVFQLDSRVGRWT